MMFSNRRLENAENDCSLAGEGGGGGCGGHHYSFGGQQANGGPQTGVNGGPGTGYGGRQYSNSGPTGQFEFPSLRADYDSTVSHPTAQVCTLCTLYTLYTVKSFEGFFTVKKFKTLLQFTILLKLGVFSKI